MTRICPSCGRETKVVVRGLCPECYVRHYGILSIEEKHEYEICRYCGSIRIKGKWIQVHSFHEAVNNIAYYIVRRSIDHAMRTGSYAKNIKLERIEYETMPNWSTKISLHIKADIDDVPVREIKIITIRLRPSICPLCKVRVSGEYDTVLQIRGKYDPDKLENNIYMEILKLGLSRSFVDLVRIKKQINVYFSDRGSALKLAKSLSKYYKSKISGIEHEQVTVTSSGKKRTRKTVTLHLNDTAS
ncbi:MAG: 60S ribosomal export protein NMD3 [Desulfurococcales archaeon]|nr:60S ribosomal export protein NMD3 [Desulfurococcales archaeon]